MERWLSHKVYKLNVLGQKASYVKAKNMYIVFDKDGLNGIQFHAKTEQEAKVKAKEIYGKDTGKVEPFYNLRLGKQRAKKEFS